MSHTPEPWIVAEDTYGVTRIWSPDGNDVATTEGDGSIHDEQRQANAFRIVACVNWCQGVTTEFLETASKDGMLTTSIKEIQERNAKLVATLDNIASRANHALARGMLLKGALENIRDDAYDALAKL